MKITNERATEGDWPNGYVYVVYDLIKDEKVVYSLQANRYKNLPDLEAAFTAANPYVEALENSGLQKPQDIKSYYELVEDYIVENYVDNHIPETGSFARHFKARFKQKPYATKLPAGEPVVVYTPQQNLFFLILLGLLIVGTMAVYLNPKILEILPFTAESSAYRRSWGAYNGDLLSFYGIFLILFLLLPTILFFISLGRVTSKIYVYRNCLIIKNCYTKQIYFYNQFDSVESDIDMKKATAIWYYTVPIIYNFIKDGETVLTLDSSYYENLSDLETVFTADNPYLELVVNTGISEMGLDPEDNPYMGFIKNTGGFGF